ncbi:Putative protein of unknown function [Podospora comata]|uniref:Uncharacterized protein n=1 Tax=Podospora comata TaxID=48703 RepID=A0ABY6SKB3_PODCO|nr:Putative protein of unknown function [Podospora comata]
MTGITHHYSPRVRSCIHIHPSSFPATSAARLLLVFSHPKAITGPGLPSANNFPLHDSTRHEFPAYVTPPLRFTPGQEETGGKPLRCRSHMSMSCLLWLPTQPSLCMCNRFPVMPRLSLPNIVLSAP